MANVRTQEYTLQRQLLYENEGDQENESPAEHLAEWLAGR